MTNEWLNDARKIPDEAMSYIRKLAVRAITDGRFRPTLVASVLNISTSAIYEWLDHYKKGGYDALDTRLAPGAEPRITREMDERIKAIVLKENPTAYGYDTQLWTCNIVAEVIEKIFLVKVLPSTVYVHLKKIGLSAQRPEYVARERDSVEIEQFLNDKFPRIQKLANKIDAEIAFEDEAGVDLTEHSGRTWGRIGETPKVIASGQRGRYNTLALVTPRGMRLRENALTLKSTLSVAVQRPLDRCLQPDQDAPHTLPEETAPLTDAPERPQPQPA